MQTVWKGTIAFGLVSIPVRLVSATEERDISFRQVRRSDGSRVRYRRVAEADGAEVSYGDIAKGYELPDGRVVVLTDEDLAALPVESSHTVEVVSFVGADDIDPTALARAYYAEPTGDVKPYVLLRDALLASDQVALVMVSLRTRERMAVLRPRDGVLVVQTMLWPDEVRRPDFAFLDTETQVRPQEMAMAKSFIDALSGPLDPTQFTDGYRTALEAVVQRKVAGLEVLKAPEAAANAGVVLDLMEALRRSVASAKEVAAKAPAKKVAAAAKAPAKKAAAAKAPAKKVAAKAPAKKAAATKSA